MQLFADEFVRELRAAGAPEGPAAEALRGLLERYRFSPPREPWCGDPARDAVILQLSMPVFRICLKYRTRNNAYDLLGEAFLALVECVDRWREVDADGNILKYVEFSVRRRIKDYIDADKAFMMPPRRAREKRASGEEVVEPSRQDIDSAPWDPNKEFDPNSRAPESRHTPTMAPDNGFDCIDFFRGRADERDRVVVEMRITGRPVEEIAERVGQKKSWVYKRLRQLEQAWACEGEPCTAS